MLILPIKRKWFDMIASGEKKEEYREIKPYWTTRFNNNLNEKNRNLINVERDLRRKYPLWIDVKFKNGYSKKSPVMICKCKIKIRQGKEEWGAEKGKEYYVLEILSVEKEV